MLKVFIRIWLLVLLPLFIMLAPSAINPISIINNYFFFDRVIDTYKGTLYLVEEKLIGTPESEWPEIIASIDSEFGYKIDIFPITENLDYGVDVSTLPPNEYLILIDSIGNDVMLKRVADSHWVIHMMLDESADDEVLMEARGTLSLLLDKFNGVNPSQLADEITQIQGHFGYELNVVSLNDINIPPEKVNQLERTGVTWIATEEQYIEIYQKLPNIDRILKAGPIPLPGPTSMVMVIILSVFAVGISLGLLVFVVPLWRDLTQLSGTATKFGSGYLKKRAEIGRFSVVGKLAASFNLMASRIEKMVDGQREMTNAIAHDLRTPLSRLSFAFEMMTSEPISQEEKERYQRVIASGIETMDHFIQQILSLSRYSLAADITNFSQCELAALIQEEVKLHQTENPELIFEWSADTTCVGTHYFVDQRAMVRALNNLLSNAIRYARYAIHISLCIDGDCYVLAVEDDGLGIAEEDQEQVFTAFKQLENIERNNSLGHGLGLAIVRQIAEWHQGYAILSTSVLGGARFEIRWPIVRR